MPTEKTAHRNIESGTWGAGVLMELANAPQSPPEILESLYGEGRRDSAIYSYIRRLKLSWHIRQTRTTEGRLMLTEKGRAEAERLRAISTS